jgi:hypothetical protein
MHSDTLGPLCFLWPPLGQKLSAWPLTVVSLLELFLLACFPVFPLFGRALTWVALRAFWVLQLLSYSAFFLPGINGDNAISTRARCQNKKHAKSEK